MTMTEAFAVLAAAGMVARAHGFECEPVITRTVLHIELQRGEIRRSVVLTEQQREACGSPAAVREQVEREVTEACRDRGAAA